MRLSTTLTGLGVAALCLIVWWLLESPGNIVPTPAPTKSASLSTSELLNVVTGRVVYQGAPVPRARVELAHRAPNYLGDELHQDGWSGLHYSVGHEKWFTDDQGYFRIPTDFPHLEYYAHAWKEGFAEGYSGLVKVGGPDVEVQLLPECALEGSILLPLSSSPEGIEVEVFRKRPERMSLESGLGLMFRTSVDDDGTWRVGSLSSGPWLVCLRVPGSLATTLGWDRARVERYGEIPWLFRAPDGGVATADLDLREEVLVELTGRLTVADQITEGYAELLLEPPLALEIAFGGVDEEGRFTLQVRQPGRYRLVINAGPGHHKYRPVTDLVDLAPGVTQWERTLDKEAWWDKGMRLDRP